MMDRLISQMSRFNQWFDGLQEPGRFLLFLVMMVVSVFVLQLGINLGNQVMITIGLVNTSIVTMIAALRATGRGGPHKLIAKCMIGAVFFIIVMAAIVT